MNRQAPSAEPYPVRESSKSVDVARKGAPGAIPMTGGVPPEDAPASLVASHQRNTMEDLVDGLDLMMRAARKLAGGSDAALEELAERVLNELQELEAYDLLAEDQRIEQLKTLCADTSEELKDVIQGTGVRIQSIFAHRPPAGM